MVHGKTEQYNTAILALNMCPSTFYPNINILLRILATLPSTMAEPERMFSKATKTLSAICSSMSEERLEACVLLQAHRDMMPDSSTIIDHLQKNSARRLNFIL
jgi:hypothetical protein